MKKVLKKTAFFLFIFGSLQTAQAQFWKKIGKRVEEVAKETVMRKAEDKAAEKTEKGMDSLLNADKKIRKKIKKKKRKDKRSLNNGSNTNQTTPNLAANYQFEWKYVLKMESNKTKGKGDLKMIYYLNSHTPTYATKFEMDGQQAMPGNMITIMDPTTGASVMLMEVEGNKIRQNMPSFSSDDEDDVAQQQAVNNYTIVKTDTKTILGYHCQGFKITSPEGVSTMYIAQNAPVSFNNTMSSDPKYKPKGFDPKWMNEFKDGLMLEMDFKSNKKEKYNIKMTCIELAKESLNINTSEYKSMF